MTMPLPAPKRKNPVLRTRQMNLPPTARTRVALGLTVSAARGEFALQRCERCAAVQYPPREVCAHCLSTALHWSAIDGAGELVAGTRLHHANDLFFRERLPWRLGLVRLDAGAAVMVHVHRDVPQAPTRVRVVARLDRAGRAVLVAVPDAADVYLGDDPMLREMTCDPRYRKALVTDGSTALGQDIARALAQAGAELIWVGQAEPWKRHGSGIERLRELPQVSIVPLDVSDSRSVEELAGAIAGKVDIVVNNAEVHRTFGVAARRGLDAARAEMEVNYFGLLRLAQSFGPALKGRSADGVASAIAWVNVLSVFALANFPPHGTYSASKAAAYSLAQCLRAEMRTAGIRVINVFPGPIDDEWNQNVPPPKLAPAALAAAIVQALRDGLEDVYPGDVAQEWLERWRQDPGVLERELAAGAER